MIKVEYMHDETNIDISELVEHFKLEKSYKKFLGVPVAILWKPC